MVAIIENAPQRIENAKTKYPGTRLFTNYKDFLAEKIEADIVAVATQDEDHKEHAIAMMEAGYDLLLEKPIATSSEEVLDIYYTAKRLGRKIYVCHVLRYAPAFLKVKEILLSV